MYVCLKSYAEFNTCKESNNLELVYFFLCLFVYKGLFTPIHYLFGHISEVGPPNRLSLKLPISLQVTDY